MLTGCAPAARSAFSAPLTVASQPFNPRSKKPLSPSTPPKHYDLGRLLVRLKRYDEAVTVLEYAATLTSTDPGIHYQLFTAYSRLKRKGDADRELEMFKRLEAERKNGETPLGGSAVNEQTTPKITESRPGNSVSDKP